MRIIMVSVLLILWTGVLHPGWADGDSSILITSQKESDWKQNYCRKQKIHIDGVDIDLGFNASLDRSVGVTLNFGTTVRLISCCKECGIKHAWCNLAAQEKECT